MAGREHSPVNPSEHLIETVVKRYTSNPHIIEAFRRVNRVDFVSHGQRDIAYENSALAIKQGKSSISQPGVVAEMLDLLDLNGKGRVLEIGTASGYNAALLAQCADEVRTVEYDPILAGMARRRLQRFGFKNVTVHTGDGLEYTDTEPFDRIIVTAGAKDIPKGLTDQLAEGGRIVIPVGSNDPIRQQLVAGIKQGKELEKFSSTYVTFVPLMSNKQEGWSPEELEARKKAENESIRQKLFDAGYTQEDIDQMVKEGALRFS